GGSAVRSQSIGRRWVPNGHSSRNETGATLRGSSIRCSARKKPWRGSSSGASNVSHGTLDSSRIVVGKPLPFSVYSADGKLLLAAGRIVETERLRDLLIASGHRTELAGGGSGGGGTDTDGTMRTRAARESAEREEEQAAARATPLERLEKDYSSNN